MSAVAPDRDALLRALLENGWRTRGRLLGIGGSIMLAFIAAAVIMPPRYVSHSTLVLLLGSEYTVRAPAGAGPESNTSFDADHILGTETEILSSADLRRDVVRAIGVARLYPKLLNPPSLPLRLLAAIKNVPDTLAQWAGSMPSRHAAADPTEEAAEILGDKLQIKPSKLASVIALGFPHRDPVVARDTLRAVERLYLQRRRALYLRQDSRAMRSDVMRARAVLDAADTALASFRRTHALPDYATQLASLLRAQADIDQDAIAARRDAAAGQARIAALELERSRLSPMVTGGSDTSLDAHTAALRDGIEALRAREAATLSRYRAESAAARDIETQITTRDDELAHAMPRSLSATHVVRNAAYDGVIGSLVELRAAQRGFDARLDDDSSEAVAVARRIASLGEHQREFDALTTRRGVVLDDLKRLEADASAQADTEAVEAASLPSVRIASAPSLPIRPVPMRILLILAGAMLAVMASAASCLLAHAARRTILDGDEFAPLGVALLARMPAGDPLMQAGPIVPVGA